MAGAAISWTVLEKVTVGGPLYPGIYQLFNVNSTVTKDQSPSLLARSHSSPHPLCFGYYRGVRRAPVVAATTVLSLSLSLSLSSLILSFFVLRFTRSCQKLHYSCQTNTSVNAARFNLVWTIFPRFSPLPPLLLPPLCVRPSFFSSFSSNLFFYPTFLSLSPTCTLSTRRHTRIKVRVAGHACTYVCMHVSSNTFPRISLFPDARARFVLLRFIERGNYGVSLNSNDVTSPCPPPLLTRTHNRTTLIRVTF